MYSNKKSGFSILDLLVKIIFVGLFIFILIWLFNKKVPNMKAFYSNVFRENISYMQEAAESYFTDDKMPAEEGDEVKLTLSEMLNKKLILPFVDEDGNSCNQYDSYVSVTKLEDGYQLKTNLVCNKESDYTIKILGCHNYCENNNCAKTCTKEQIVSYQYKKLVQGTKTAYTCKTGYALKGKYCYKSTTDSKEPTKVTTTETQTLTIPVTSTIVGGTKTKVSTVTGKDYVATIVTTNPDTTTTKQEAYSCTKYKEQTTSYSCKKTVVEKQCTTTYQTVKKACGTSTTIVDHVPVTVTNYCTESIPVESCENVSKEVDDTCTKTEKVPYQSTCYKDVVVTIPGTTSYNCPTGYTPEGSGSTMKCYKKTYSCPSNSNYSTGSDASLVCYVVTKGSVTKSCSDKTYTLKDDKCVKTVTKDVVTTKCDSGYTLKNGKCVKTISTKVKATATKKSYSYYKYTWSTETSLSGWTKTNKTKVKEGKEICE